uniref:CUB domain containing protein 1a n=1 Tax=Periophthalmus magnuspinnatus TaxID=409849 RepID=A0A3B4BM58_9GOBI
MNSSIPFKCVTNFNIEIIFSSPGSRMLTVTTDPDTKVTIRRDPHGPDLHLSVQPDIITKIVKNCTVELYSLPLFIFIFIFFCTISISFSLDCAKTSCSSDILQTEYSMFPNFNRTFIWDLKVVPTQAFQLNFPEPGMRQIPNKHSCPDEHTYSVVTYLRTGPATIGTFCKEGAVSSVLVRYKGRMFLEVPGDRNVSLYGITCIYHHGDRLSNTTFITPNYPGDFPDEEEMQWDFVVPGMHNYSMSFSDVTLPECLSDDVILEYHKTDKFTKFSLTDPQPKHQQGNFQMVLKNCATNRTLQGLTLNFKVSVMRSGHPVLCTVDLSTQQSLSLQIEKVGSDPNCEMTLDSKLQTKINVASGTKGKLSFLDCPNEDLQLTTTQVIECQDYSSCPEYLLTTPKLDSCLPMPLHSATWKIVMPEDGTVDLVSPTGTLKQSLVGQECRGPVSLHLEESEGVSMGDFCFNGPIQKVQAHTNISITVKTNDLKKYKGHFLNVSFSPEISETMIYRVTPDPTAPSLLGTPNWPRGMSRSSTVSWIMTLPRNYQALLHFPNVSQPKCADRHTSITVQMLGYEEELMSRREDETMDEKLIVPYSFYLNMSNCVPEEGDFGAVTKIVLSTLLTFSFFHFIVFHTRKKKQKMSNESSIYIGKGNIFRPSDRTFSKSRSDNDSHVYASIDETLTYGHLLGDGSYADSMSDHFKGIQTDSYHTFTGPTDTPALPTIKEPDLEPELDEYRGFLKNLKNSKDTSRPNHVLCTLQPQKDTKLHLTSSLYKS